MRYIYIYEQPDAKQKGWIKIGDSKNFDRRIKEQLNTAAVTDASNLEYSVLYKCKAIKDDGSSFRDYDIHALLVSKGYHKQKVMSGDKTLKGNTEWFKIELDKAIFLIEQFKKGYETEEINIQRFQSFKMRPEQEKAVNMTIDYFNSNVNNKNVSEMLWNAKMRFGKTFASYQLALKMQFSKVLILTYKPAVEDAWKKDLENHTDFEDYIFLSREALSSINSYLDKKRKIVAFASYQDILGTKNSDIIIKDKHTDLFSISWDLIIIDEFHFGAGTKKAKEILIDELEQKKISSTQISKIIETELFSEDDEELESEKICNLIVSKAKEISSKFRLYLSGTPFKALADSQFENNAIFNWTYTDEQKAKAEWNINNPKIPCQNPYRLLPEIQLYLYQVSSNLISAGITEGKDEFSLNYFFKTKEKKFINEKSVVIWLDLISGVIRPFHEVEEEIHEEIVYEPSQYPYDHKGKLITKIDHTLWYLNRVDSAYALEKLLKKHVVFSKYHIINVAGNDKSGIDVVQPVLDAIDRYPKTITLSVGKLTTGVSIPKWKGVLFLRDISSPENYFQTAFRAQTPFRDPDTNQIKETCYIFDFSPNRALRLLTTYSEKLATDSKLATSEERINEFIRYLPVLKVAGNKMVTLDAKDVLTFDLTGVDAKGLGERFVERKNVIVNNNTIDAINATPQTLARCKEIFDRIKKFRKYNGASEKEQRDTDVDMINLDVNNKKIKALETTAPKDPKGQSKNDKEKDLATKEIKTEREKIRELLRTLLSRIPIFMYLTDATEENLEQILINPENDLFRKTTGIEIDDFKYLIELGLLKIDSLDGYILKFLDLENQNFTLANTL